MTEPQAREAAAEILRVEANELAGWLSLDNRTTYHRVSIAVRIEMNRLREISRVLSVDDVRPPLEDCFV